MLVSMRCVTNFEITFIFLLSPIVEFSTFIGESIRPPNKMMNIHRERISGCEISIKNDQNVCKNNSFTIQITEKIPAKGYKNGSMTIKCLNVVCSEKITGWKKTTIYPYELNDKTKCMNKTVPVGKVFPPLPSYGESLLNFRTQNHLLLIWAVLMSSQRTKQLLSTDWSSIIILNFVKLSTLLIKMGSHKPDATLTTLGVVWPLWSLKIFFWCDLYWLALKEWNSCCLQIDRIYVYIYIYIIYIKRKTV